MAEVLQLAVGTIFAGDYRIVLPLAEGGMGALYLADQLSTGNRRVLKLMQPQLVSDQRLRERFALEARIGSQIESDHVVQVLGAGVDPTFGVPWLAMELLRGEDLATTIAKRGRLTPAEVREIFGQLCHALAAAHDRGIVHRDIKPENVFLAVPRVEAATFLVKVLDFGIAKLVAEAQTKRTSAIGSPLWMAPEQTDGGRGVSVATDVWPLGLIAFYALTGQYFWRAATDSMVALIREIVFENIPPATVRAAELGVRQYLPPRGFDEWFLRCVARAPVDRFASVREARAGLDAILSPQAYFATGDHDLQAPRAQPEPIAPTAAFSPGTQYAPPPQHQAPPQYQAPPQPPPPPDFGATAGVVPGGTSPAVAVVPRYTGPSRTSRRSAGGAIATVAGLGVLGAIIIAALARPGASTGCRVGDIADCAKRCEKNNGMACNNLGVSYEEGIGVGKDAAHASTFYKQACDAGEPPGCLNLGLLYQNGNGVSKDPSQAAAFYKKGCDRGQKGACTNLGTLYEAGDAVPKDPTRAAALYQQACDAHYADACANLGRLYDDGAGVEKSASRAAALYKQACDAGSPPSCAMLGTAYARGVPPGIPKDPVRAAALYKQACDAGFGPGCANLGVSCEAGSGIDKDPARAARLYEQACNAGVGLGCLRLGVLTANGTGVTEDPVRAIALYKQACDAGTARGCTELGFAYENGTGVVKDAARAVAYHQQACDAGDAYGCSSLGAMYFKGTGVAKSPERAFALSQQGCTEGAALGCYNLGACYADGAGVAKDLVRAAALFTEACENKTVPGGGQDPASTAGCTQAKLLAARH